MIDASCGKTERAARKVKPIPRPPISTFGRARPLIFSRDSVASASSEPLRRLFISSFEPSMIENSLPRCLRRNSPLSPGMGGGIKLNPGEHVCRASRCAVPLAQKWADPRTWKQARGGCKVCFQFLSKASLAVALDPTALWRASRPLYIAGPRRTAGLERVERYRESTARRLVFAGSPERRRTVEAAAAVHAHIRLRKGRTGETENED